MQKPPVSVLEYAFDLLQGSKDLETEVIVI